MLWLSRSADSGLYALSAFALCWSSPSWADSRSADPEAPRDYRDAAPEYSDATRQSETKAQIAILVPPFQGRDRKDIESAAERLRELPIEVSSYIEETQGLDAAIRSARAIVRNSHPLGVIWLGQRDGTRTLFVHDPRTDHTLARRLAGDSNSVAEREELAIIVRGTVTALLEGAKLEMEEVKPQVLDGAVGGTQVGAPAGKNERRPTRGASGATSEKTTGVENPASISGETRASARSSLAVRLGYQGMTGILNRDRGWENGASVGARWFFTRELEADLAYTFVPTAEVSAFGTNATFSRHPTTLGLGVALHDPVPAFRWWAAELTATADRVSRTTLSTDSALSGTADEARWLFSFGIRAGGALRVANRLSLYALFSGDVIANPIDYVVENVDGRARFGTSAFGVKADLGVAFDVVLADPKSP